jgi:hypothetical protein
MAVPFLACMVATAAFYHLPPRALPAIQAVEGGTVGTVHHNTDETDDYGPMQVNTRWVQPIARVTGLPANTVRTHLVYDACFNVAAAGAILRLELDEARGDIMAAVGAYHSHTPSIADAYRLRVVWAARKLFGGDTPR